MLIIISMNIPRDREQGTGNRERDTDGISDTDMDTDRDRDTYRERYTDRYRDTDRDRDRDRDRNRASDRDSDSDADRTRTGARTWIWDEPCINFADGSDTPRNFVPRGTIPNSICLEGYDTTVKICF